MNRNNLIRLTRSLSRPNLPSQHSLHFKPRSQHSHSHSNRPPPPLPSNNKAILSLTPTSSLYGALDQHNPIHYGKYTKVRECLDWKYHTVPNKERQLLQDDIVDRALDSVESEEEELDGGNGLMRKGCGEGGVGKGEKPLALFTAGCVPVPSPTWAMQSRF